MNFSNLKKDSEKNLPVFNENLNTILTEGQSSFHPLSLGQQALWFLYQMAPESVAYNSFHTALIGSKLDIKSWQRAYKKIVNRHPILRTTYTTHQGKPVQVIHQQIKLPIQEIDASQWTENELREKIFLETDRVFNLEKEPAWRVTLFTRSEREHIFLTTMHHIASDLWSSDLLFTELRFWYAAETEQVSPQQIEDYLPKNLPYTDFVYWQSEMLSSPKAEKHWEYWQKQLSGDLAILNLPTDRPRKPVQTFRGETHIFRLDEKLIQGLTEVTRATGTTLYKLMLTAFFVLLYRYTNQEDILVGTPMLGRPGREFRGVVGYFVNPAVLRTSISGKLTFQDLLERVSTQVKAAQKHQDYPFPLLVEQLQPRRDPSHPQLFQVSFTWQKQRWYELGKELGLKMEPYPLGHQRGASFDLDVMMMEMGEVLLAGWQYNTDLFDASTIAQMAGHYQILLKGIVANPQQPISELPLLTEQERHQLLVKWNNTWAEYPQDRCIHQLFEEQAERSPDAVAVVFEGKQLTYSELNAKANQLAHYLQSLGVGPEVLVGICVERSLEMIIGLLGILKAGGAYVPLDPNYPSERLAFMLEDSSAPVLLTQQKLVEKLSLHSARVVCLDFDKIEIFSQSEENPTSKVTPDNLAYIIYTSGSTGKPKGVSILQRGVVRLVKETNYANLSAEEVFLQLAPISFDASTFEIWGSLLNGARLVIMPPHTPPLQELGQALRQYQVTTLWLTAGLFHLMVDERLDDLKNVRQLLAGGDVLSVPHVKKLLHQLKGCNLINGYGPTENTTFTCCYAITDPSQIENFVPIGRPIANTQVYLLDPQMQPVPIGVPGELYIGGDGLARGYLNRPDLTEAKFIPNPFSNEPGERLYKTGDLARYLPDGNIEYLGRIDNQVKVRGFRIELGEVEATIAQHPDVASAAVIVREDIPGNKRLVAYVVPAGSRADTSELRSFLKAKLPDYMIPAAFVMLDALPLTPNGKVDRRALPAPDISSSSPSESFVPPQTATEKVLATIWAEVLQVSPVGIGDNFFSLGGDSILSLQIVARCHQAGLKLTPKDLFQHQTIAELARVVGQTVKIQTEQGLITGAVPLTPILQWFLEQKSPEPQHFNQSFLFEVSPDLKPELLQQVVRQLLQHHDALRLRLISESDTKQLFNAETEETEVFSLVDLSAVATAELPAAIEATAAQLQRSLNLSVGPLLRVALFNLGPGKTSRLLIVIHHIAVDGVSWRILLEDLATACQQLNRTEPIELPAKTTAFKDWAVRLADYARSQAAAAELDYWLAQSGSEIAPIPVDYPEGKQVNTIAECAQVSVSLSAEQTSALLKEVPSAYNTQINDVLLTALVQSFAEWTGQTSLLIDLEGHGREELFESVNLSRTVGWFTSMFPVLLKLEQAEFPGKSLKSIKEQLRHIPQRGIGYGILRYLSPDETARHQLQQKPQAQVSFNYLGQFDQMLSTFPLLGLAKESIGSPVSPKWNRSHLIEIDGFVADGRLSLTWTYNTQFHQKTTIERLAKRFIEALTEIISHCLSVEDFGCTSTDFPEVELTQEELDELVNSLRPKIQIESIYPLSPMQQGMLFHTLMAPDSGVYFEQLLFTLRGNLNVSAFEQAWRRVVERHPILRTLFVWENRKQPLQVVCKSVNLPWTNLDWRSLSEIEQQERLEAFLQDEQNRGFELNKAPLMRCTLIRVHDKAYQFALSNHHLLMDGWSLPLVLKEVLAFYEAFAVGENLYLEVPPPYQNYISWLQQQDLSAALNFWQQTLQGFTTPTPMVVDKSVGDRANSKQTYSEQKLNFSTAVTSALKSLARQHQLTLNTLVQGAWALLLNRYSGESDILFGATVSGRPPALSGVESMVGLFINTLPVRVRLSPETELLSWLKQLQAQQVERELYSYTPLVEIHGVSEVPRNLPLFESIVVFENYPVSSSLLEGKASLKISNVRVFERTNYPLTVVAVPGEELSVAISYDTSRFDEGSVRRLLGHFQSLLEGIIANPQAPIYDLPLLTDQERHQLLVEWNNTWAEYPQDKCIHKLFEEQVEQSPDAVAVVFEEERLTYEELNAKANQLAHYLRSLGVGPEVLVGLCVERSFEMIVGILGILKAGGAYVPLDPAYPKERLAFMLEDSSASVLLTQPQLVEKLPQSSSPLAYLDFKLEQLSFQSQSNPHSLVTPGNLAYIIYTSGSTGRPKGVAIEHHSTVAFLSWAEKFFTVEDITAIFASTSISFDLSVFELFVALCRGGKVILAENALSLPTLAGASEITLINTVPSAIAELVRLKGIPTGVHTINLAGEALPNKLVQQLYEQTNVRQVFNLYGPSEDTTYSTIALVEKGARIVTIGRPISNTQIYLLDSYLQPVPIGVFGELYISGDRLARGYLNRPELTAQKFIPNPFSDEPGARLYKTGDLARYLPDGNIEFLGRLDSQVKVRGFRIELGEIESVLAQHPDVRSAAVTVREDTPGDKRLVAYFVPEQEPAPTISDLRRFLLKQLPEYMVPTAFAMLLALPLTANGKVDRRSLPAPDISHISLETTFVAPRSNLEMQLVPIWENVLNVHPIGVRDSFFDRGGHSLLAVRLMALLQQQFGKSLPLATLFQNPTIEHQASLVLQQTDSQPFSPLVAIQPAGSQPPFFCVHPVGGNVLCYFDLARHLGKDRPFYGLQSAGLNGEGEPLTRIEDMAARYIEALQVIQPSGPYYLGGWSLGGLVAFEMAQQLRDRGEEVALLALIDSYAPAAINWHEDNMNEASLLVHLARDLGSLFGKELPLSADELQQFLPLEQLNYIHKQAKNLNILPPEVSLEQMRHLLRVFQANIEAMSGYIPQPYPGKITLLPASEKPLQVKLDPTQGWGELATGGIDIHPIPGDHYAIVREPHVQLLAQQLETYLKTENQ